VHGGYDSKGNLTDDPTEIMRTQRSLPIGYWKGSGLSLLLDLVASILSGGLSVGEITAQGPEKNLSQVFIAINASNNAIARRIIDDFKTSVPATRYPGENVLKTREKNLMQGIPVPGSIWREIKGLT
jgi:3-dehydro-L-gulonate 2-dehydrogenase